MNNQLTSYAIIREFYNNQIGIRQIIFEFIKKWLLIENLNSKNSKFSVNQLSTGMQEHLGVNIPFQVINDVLKSYKHKYFLYANNIYKLKEDIPVSSESLNKFETETNNKNILLTNLTLFINNSTSSTFSESEINDFLISYINEEEVNETIKKYISLFILNNNRDSVFDRIKEGQLFFSSITFESNFSNDYSIRDPITMYLDTEILFNALGYNGQDYKDEFMIFYELISKFNENNNNAITLKFLSTQKSEIENIFSVIECRFHEDFSDKLAFLNIKKEAKEKKNVLDIKVEFFHKLEALNITFDSRNINVENKFNLIYDEEQSNSLLEWANRTSRSIDFSKVSTLYKNVHSIIYQLRNGNENLDFSSLKAIFISGDALTNKISFLEKIKLNQKISLSVYMEELLVRLWFKSYTNIGTSLKLVSMDSKARIILQELLGKKIQNLIFEAKEKFDSGLLSEKKLNDLTTNCLKTIFDISEKNIDDNVIEMLNVETLDEKLHFLEQQKIQYENTKFKNIELEEALEKEAKQKNELIEENRKLKATNNQIIKNEEEKKKKRKIFFYIICILLICFFPIIYDKFILKNNWITFSKYQALSLVLLISFIPFFLQLKDVRIKNWNFWSRYTAFSFGIFCISFSIYIYMFFTSESSKSTEDFIKSCGIPILLGIGFTIIPSVFSNNKNTSISN
ncbi:MAG: hypothetical protein ACRC4T_25730 [Cetobacterium sp.]